MWRACHVPSPAQWPEDAGLPFWWGWMLHKPGAQEVNHSVLEGDMCSEVCEGDGERGAWCVCSFWWLVRMPVMLKSAFLGFAVKLHPANKIASLLDFHYSTNLSQTFHIIFLFVLLNQYWDYFQILNLCSYLFDLVTVTRVSECVLGSLFKCVNLPSEDSLLVKIGPPSPVGPKTVSVKAPTLWQKVKRN